MSGFIYGGTYGSSNAPIDAGSSGGGGTSLGKAAGGGVRVLSELSLAEPKTKALTTLMKALGLQGAVLFVVDRLETNLTLASRNLPDVEVTTARYVNTYQLLQYPVVIFTKLAADALKGRLEDRTGRAA